MGVRVLPVAVGVGGIVVPPIVLGADDLVEHALDVVEERGLPLVHEERHRGVQRGEEDHPLLDVVPLDDGGHLLGEVVELEPLVGDDPERFRDHAHGLQPALRSRGDGRIRCCHG
jgi:hypothetical protein